MKLTPMHPTAIRQAPLDTDNKKTHQRPRTKTAPTRIRNPNNHSIDDTTRTNAIPKPPPPL